MCRWLPDSLPVTPNIIWQQPLGRPGLGGVAATSRHVVLGDRDLNDLHDVFRCYDADEGTELWTLSYPTVGQLDYGNTPRATPLLYRGRAYLLGAFGHLHCVELATGKVLWKRALSDEFPLAEELRWGVCGSPLMAGEKLIVTPGAKDASIVALAPDDGAVVWKAPGAAPAYGSFVSATLGGRHQVVGHDRISLGGWDVQTGERLWTLTPPFPDDFNVPTPVVVGGQLLVTSENNGTRLYGFRQGGEIISEPMCTNENVAPDVTSPVVADSKAYTVSGDLFCLDISDGLAEQWRLSDDTLATYGAVVTDGKRLLAIGAGGALILLEPTDDGAKIVSRLRVFDETEAELYSHPAFVGNRLYIRGESSLVCLDLAEIPR